MADPYKSGLISGIYGQNPYYTLYNYGNFDYTTPGSGMMPGMTPESPSFGSAGSMNYTPPSTVADKGWKGMSGLEKMSAIGEGISAFGTLANLYAGFKSMQLQQDQFKFAKSAWNKNFATQIASYNNSQRDNWMKYAGGNKFFGNTDYLSEDEWMNKYSLSA